MLFRSNLWQAVRARLGERGQVAQGGAKAAGVVDVVLGAAAQALDLLC